MKRCAALCTSKSVHLVFVLAKSVGVYTCASAAKQKALLEGHMFDSSGVFRCYTSKPFRQQVESRFIFTVGYDIGIEL